MATDYGLDGRAAIVTGGGGGIGTAVARTLARSGASVIVADLDAAAAQAAVAAIAAEGGTAVAHQVDVTDPEAVHEMVEACLRELGGLDIAVNNAGIHGDPASPALADFSIDWWRRTMAINLDAIFFCLREEIRAMRAAGGGAIVNMASVYAQVTDPGVSAYTASKHGVVGLTKAAAVDHAADGVRVNAVGPGFIDAGLVHRHIPEVDRPQFAARHPLGRLGTADEVAELIAFLVSDGAAFITGSYHPVEGGYLTR
jgi:NAD(P)-dependent dehydrogenase (short-subunit alcohol dehydrogenase family)